MNDRISDIPTNIITGFLGTGKTSAILHLLKSKPHNERWAVLVNEFGEIGIDGSLIHGQEQGDKVFIKEVPGGCMCCTAGVPMQIALNKLLAESRPNRLLIEPTGLGHPKEILQTLSSEYFKDVIKLEKIITLVDARKLADQRYTSNETFNQQIDIADIIVGNKLDLYSHEEITHLLDYVESRLENNTQLLFTQNGELETMHLLGPSASKINFSSNSGISNGGIGNGATEHSHSSQQDKRLPSEEDIPECGYIQATNTGEGFVSQGWRFSPDRVFKYEKLFALLSGLKAERMKAVFITEDGVFAYNLTPDTLTEFELDDTTESRIEIIARQAIEKIEQELLGCLAN